MRGPNNVPLSAPRSLSNVPRQPTSAATGIKPTLPSAPATKVAALLPTNVASKLAASHLWPSAPGSAAAASSAASTAAGSSSGAVAQSAKPSSTGLSYTLRLVVHPKSFSNEDLILNPKSCPNLKVGDIIEIFQTEAALAANNNTNAAGGNTAAGNTQQRGSLAGGGMGSNHSGSSAQSLSAPKSAAAGSAVASSAFTAASSASSAAASAVLDPHSALFLKITSLDPVKANFDVSLSSTLAELFGLQHRKDVVVRVVDPSRCGLDFIEISFKNQYIGRSDNWRCKHFMQDSTVFTGASVSIEGMKLRVDEIVSHGRPAKSGLITSATRFTFRSRSARLFFLIQLSEEMWEFADDGELYFEKVLGFLKILWAEWSKLKVSHAVSIIFFSRTYLEKDETWKPEKGRRKGRSGKEHTKDEEDEEDAASEEDGDEEEDDADEDSLPFERARSQSRVHPYPSSSPPASSGIDSSHRPYQDHYMVVLDNEVHDSKSSSDELLKLLKKRFNKYHKQLKWDITDPATGMRGSPSTAAEGNFLEAIGCGISVYDKHYLDRDLYKTGQNMVLFSAGIGMFVVDPRLARLTKQRMVDGGIGCDLICTTRPPLHSLPLFQFRGGAMDAEEKEAQQAALHKEQAKMARAQTQPLFNASTRRSSHLNSQFQTLQHAIHEGSEENEEKSSTSEKPTGQAAVVSVTPVEEAAPPPNEPAPAAATAAPAVSLVSFAGGDSVVSDIQLPPSSVLHASRIEASPSPNSTAAASSTPASSSSSSSSATPPIGGSHVSPAPSPRSSSPAPHSHALPSLPFHSPGDHGSRGSSDAKPLDRASSLPGSAAAGEGGSQPPTTQYSVPHWLSIYFYDYQDLYDTPFGKLKTSHRDDTSRNRNEEFVSLSSCKLFDFFDLSFFNTARRSTPHVIPYLPGKELPPPVKPHLFEAYDATVFNSTHLPIGYGVIDHMQQPHAQTALHHSTRDLNAALNHAANNNKQPVTPPSPTNHHGSSGSSFSPPNGATDRNVSPQPSSRLISAGGPHGSPAGPANRSIKSSPNSSSNSLVSSPEAATTSGTASASSSGHKKDRKLSGSSSKQLLSLPKKTHKNTSSSGSNSSSTSVGSGDGHPQLTTAPGHSSATSSGSGLLVGATLHSDGTVSGSGAPLAPPALPSTSSTTSGPNVALQQHIMNQGLAATGGGAAKPPTTAFQTRWGHLFGHLYATLDHLHNPLRPNWKSLCQPAVLPLTTEYWPAQTELRRDYSEYNHTLVLVQNQNDYNNEMAGLLEEMICQRQAQDYQHIVSDLIPRPKPGVQVFYFSLRNQVHIISWDTRTASIDVRRHIHKRVIQDRKLVKFPYEYFLWSPHTASFLPVQRDMEPNRDDVPWSYADNVLCDNLFHTEELDERIKYRRNHYAIIPAAIPPGKYPVSFYFPSAAAGAGSKASKSSAAHEALRAKFEAEWRAESQKRLQAFKQFFVLMFSERGDKIVSAATSAASIAANTAGKDAARLEKDAAASVAATAALDKAFAAFGIEVDSASDRLPFPLPPLKDEEQRRKDEARAADHLDQYENALGFAIADVSTQRIKIPLSKPPVAAGSADGAPSSVHHKSSRFEWFQLQYDSVFNPHAVYHLEIKWLVATGMHLESWLKNFLRKAETRFGIQVVKIPTNQPSIRTADSFHVPVPLHCPDPALARMVDEFLVGQGGFVMDSELQGSVARRGDGRARRGRWRARSVDFDVPFIVCFVLRSVAVVSTCTRVACAPCANFPRDSFGSTTICRRPRSIERRALRYSHESKRLEQRTVARIDLQDRLAGSHCVVLSLCRLQYATALMSCRSLVNTVVSDVLALQQMKSSIRV